MRKLIAGPSVYICDECVGLCTEILEEENLPPRVRVAGALPFARRDTIVVEVRRALEAAFPERAGEMMRDLEALIAPGGPLVCHDCREARTSIPDPCPEDWVCPDFREETWTAQGYRRADGVAVAWPWLLVLERGASQPRHAVEYVLLAPLILRRPVQFTGRLAPPA